MSEKIKVEISSWSKVYRDLPVNNDNVSFFKLLNEIYKRLNENEQFVYFVDYKFGDRIISKGKMPVDDFILLSNEDNIFGRNNENFKLDINYSSDPLGIISTNEAWIVTNDDKVRLGKLEEGELFGVFGTLDFLNFEKSNLYGDKDWSVISGDSSFHLFFNFALNEVEENFRKIYLNKDSGGKFIKRRDKFTYNNDLSNLQKNIEFVNSLNLEPKTTRVIYLPRHIFNANNSNLKYELLALKAINYIYKKGWEQSKPIRNSLFEDGELNEKIRKLNLSYKEEFLIPFYVYCYHVAKGEKESLMILNDSDEKENEYLTLFKELNHKVYFDQTNPNLPLILKFKKIISKKDFGIVSANHLPIPNFPIDFFEKYPKIVENFKKIQNALNHTFEISYYNTRPYDKCDEIQIHQDFIEFICEKSKIKKFNFSRSEHQKLIKINSELNNIFPEYYVLSELEKEFNKSDLDLSEFYIISVQHLLRSTGSLFESLINIGFDPQNIYLTGKIYSTHNETKEILRNHFGIEILESTVKDRLGEYSIGLKEDINLMWESLLKKINNKPNSKIIILDDGGHILRSVTKDLLKNPNVELYGIEQTTSGIRGSEKFEKFPIIDVAGSAAKVLIEPTLVSEAINIQLHRQFIKFQKDRIGIIGYGHIGKAIAKEYEEKGYQIFIYDEYKSLKDVNPNIKVCDSALELYKSSQIIIGATGDDISDERWITECNEDKIFMSVSSGDIEFNKFIQNPHFEDLNSFENLKKPFPLRIKELTSENHYKLTILRGGMVSNFTGSADSSPGKYIQITRGLLFSAIIQILRNESNLINGILKLDASLQKKVVNDWFIDQPQKKIEYSEDVLNTFNDIQSINKKSGGV